jgi:excisionase family DNA binding protein
MEKMWRVREICDGFDVSYSSAMRWVSSGKLPVVKLPGGQLRVKDSEVRRILDEERVTA